jgi:16S rRNA (cytosine1402-N4)-methyltransferase
MWEAERRHVPVLLDAVVAALRPRPGRIIVDGTFGGGGYSRALLAAGARVVGIDRDPAAVALGRVLAAAEPRFAMCAGPFGAMAELVGGLGVTRVDGIVLDLGLSSLQLDDASRGFSFQKPGPLDMRMSAEGATAAELLAGAAEEELATVLRLYGDEPDARRIARAIVRRRAAGPLTRTDELAELVAGVKGARRGAHDPATRTFQAIRIWVNDEQGELDRALAAAETLLADGGRLVTVCFHSGEDARVKRFIDERGGRPASVSRHAPPVAANAPAWLWLGRKVVTPSDRELAGNPRARSARMRVAVRRRLADDPPEERHWQWRAAA